MFSASEGFYTNGIFFFVRKVIENLEDNGAGR